MKTVKLLEVLLIAIVCVGLSSCSEEKIAEENLIGKWETTWAKGWILEDGTKENFDYAESGVFVIFERGGTGYSYEFDSGEEESHSIFEWKLKGNSLKVYFEEEDYEEGEFKILLLNSTTMQLEFSQPNRYRVGTYTRR
jgi:hypothetical protein